MKAGNGAALGLLPLLAFVQILLGYTIGKVQFPHLLLPTLLLISCFLCSSTGRTLPLKVLAFSEPAPLFLTLVPCPLFSSMPSFEGMLIQRSFPEVWPT